MGRLRKRLLPRKELNARKYTQIRDEYNFPEEHYEYILLEDCGVQPMGEKQSATFEGYRDAKLYKVFTETEVPTIREGNGPKGERYVVEAFPDIWCHVIESYNWSYGVQSHYELVVAQTNER